MLIKINPKLKTESNNNNNCNQNFHHTVNPKISKVNLNIKINQSLKKIPKIIWKELLDLLKTPELKN